MDNPLIHVPTMLLTAAVLSFLVGLGLSLVQMPQQNPPTNPQPEFPYDDVVYFYAPSLPEHLPAVRYDSGE